MPRLFALLDFPKKGFQEKWVFVRETENPARRSECD
jgi:hypothetical protein